MMRARHDAAPHELLTRTPAMNRDLKTFIATVITRAVLPTLLLVTAVAFIAMPYTLGHHPGEAETSPQATAGHMT
jgi:hypothetical protein